MITDSTYRTAAINDTREDPRARLAQYLAQQTEGKQALHRVLRALEAAALVPIAATFAVAMYVSINHTGVRPEAIAVSWMGIPVSAVPLMLLTGLHTIVLRATPLVRGSGRAGTFFTGTRAVWSGVAIVATALAAGAFWGGFAWAIWSGNVALALNFAGILINLLSVLIPVAVIASIVQKVLRIR